MTTLFQSSSTAGGRSRAAPYNCTQTVRLPRRLRVRAFISCKAVGSSEQIHSFADARRNKFLALHKFRVERQSFAQDEPAHFGFLAEPRDLRPSCFGIDEILRHWRNSAPIVDSGVQ